VGALHGHQQGVEHRLEQVIVGVKEGREHGEVGTIEDARRGAGRASSPWGSGDAAMIHSSRMASAR
jgi:hypothetical protein